MTSKDSKKKHEPTPPTKEMRTEIYKMLEVCYDRKKLMYAGNDTDQTIAKELGIKTWGWVKEVREGFFGPERNEAEEIDTAKVSDWLKKADSQVEQIQIALGQLETTRKEAKALLIKLKGLVDRRAA
jgi:hypothetical protein